MNWAQCLRTSQVWAGLSVWEHHHSFIPHLSPGYLCFPCLKTARMYPSHSAALKASSFCRNQSPCVPETDEVSWVDTSTAPLAFPNNIRRELIWISQIEEKIFLASASFFKKKIFLCCHHALSVTFPVFQLLKNLTNLRDFYERYISGRHLYIKMVRY
jgi:hypothetical protein